MSSPLPRPAWPVRMSGRSRLVAAAMALTMAISLLSALVLAFDSASPAQWLAATPEVLRAVSACDAQRARADRQTCKQELVAQHRPAASSPQRLAER